MVICSARGYLLRMTLRRSLGLAAAVTAVALGTTSLTGPADATRAPERSAARLQVEDLQVLVISLDGLNPTAITQLGQANIPNLWRMFAEGAGTLNARAQYELTVTLPNHTSMVTGRRINKQKGGHGVTWNDDRPGTVRQAAGEYVASIFSVLQAKGESAAVFASKTKFDLFDRSWPTGVDKNYLRDEEDQEITTAAIADMSDQDRAFTFLHLAAADKAGHRHRWMSQEYLDAVVFLDGLVGQVLNAVDTDPDLADVTIILTADHGGVPGTRQHGDETKLDNYRVPFVVWGGDAVAGNIYDYNPGYQSPGKKRLPLSGKQPIRNGNVANLALDLLGFGTVPGSLFGKKTDIEIAPPT